MRSGPVIASFHDAADGIDASVELEELGDPAVVELVKYFGRVSAAASRSP